MTSPIVRPALRRSGNLERHQAPALGGEDVAFPGSVQTVVHRDRAAARARQGVVERAVLHVAAVEQDQPVLVQGLGADLGDEARPGDLRIRQVADMLPGRGDGAPVDAHSAAALGHVDQVAGSEGRRGLVRDLAAGEQDRQGRQARPVGHHVADDPAALEPEVLVADQERHAAAAPDQAVLEPHVAHGRRVGIGRPVGDDAGPAIADHLALLEDAAGEVRVLGLDVDARTGRAEEARAAGIAGVIEPAARGPEPGRPDPAQPLARIVLGDHLDQAVPVLVFRFLAGIGDRDSVQPVMMGVDILDQHIVAAVGEDAVGRALPAGVTPAAAELDARRVAVQLEVPHRDPRTLAQLDHAPIGIGTVIEVGEARATVVGLAADRMEGAEAQACRGLEDGLLPTEPLDHHRAPAAGEAQDRAGLEGVALAERPGLGLLADNIGPGRDQERASPGGIEVGGGTHESIRVVGPPVAPGAIAAQVEHRGGSLVRPVGCRLERAGQDAAAGERAQRRGGLQNRASADTSMCLEHVVISLLYALIAACIPQVVSAGEIAAGRPGCLAGRPQ